MGALKRFQERSPDEYKKVIEDQDVDYQEFLRQQRERVAEALGIDKQVKKKKKKRKKREVNVTELDFRRYLAVAQVMGEALKRPDPVTGKMVDAVRLTDSRGSYIVTRPQPEYNIDGIRIGQPIIRSPKKAVDKLANYRKGETVGLRKKKLKWYEFDDLCVRADPKKMAEQKENANFFRMMGYSDTYTEQQDYE